ncbi:MAG: hypothetical protein ABL861_02675 [Nitrosomonas sp.]
MSKIIFFSIRANKIFMKGDHQVILAIIIFFSGVAFGNLVTTNVITFSYFIPAFATLIAAFVGARYAFELSSLKEERNIRERNRIAANLASFNMLQMLNILLNYQSQFIDLDKIRNNDYAFLELKPALTIKDVCLDLNSLAFLLDGPHVNFLGELNAEQIKFRSLIDAINLHSQDKINKLQPALEKTGFNIDEVYPPLSKFEEILGPHLFHTMCGSTKQIIEKVDSNILSLQEVIAKFRIILEETFPNERKISVKILAK